MKKDALLQLHRRSYALSKTLKIMRLTIILIIISLFQVTASTYSQSTKLNLKFENETLERVFRKIEESSEFSIFYKNELIKNALTINGDFKNVPVSEILDKVLSSEKLSYVIKDKLILIVQKNSDINKIAQQQKITGTITDASSGEAIIGANIIIEGSTLGTVTDVNGKFSLDLPNSNAILVVSFIGYNTERISPNGQTNLDIKLIPDIKNLEEVVVVGYGTLKKKDLTGSVASVDMGKKEMAANVDLTQALQGYVPGVNAGAAGKAGQAGSLSIRGRTSLSANDNPLIVLDGIIFNGSTTDIDVNDIETIDILKDASAAAVYGSRSANGVIIISTKRGKSSKPMFDFNMYYGYQDIAPSPRTDVMTGDEYAVRMVDYYYQQTLYNWYRTNPAVATGRPVRPDVTDRNLVAKSLRTIEEQENYLAGKETNWIKEVTRTAPIQNYNLNVSGKTDRTNYFLSGTFTDQKGVMINDQFKRSTLRANFENKITNWFTLGLNTSYSHVDYSGLSEEYLEDGVNYAGMYLALIASPWANMYNSNGIYPTVLTGETYQRHPLGNNLVNDLDIGDNLFTVISAKIDIPKISGLRYEINYSNTYSTKKHNKFYPATTFEGATNNGLAIKQLSEERNWLINNILSYTKTFGKHRVDGTLLYSRESRNGESSNLNSNTFGNPVLGFNAMQLGETRSLSTGAWEENTISYMARVNYGFNSKYLITTTFRRDGFSGFGLKNKYANFPSLSLGWVASEESFLKGTRWLDFLKLRLSYGANGNQGIGRYSSLARMGTINYTFNGVTSVGVHPTTLGNSNLGWESTASTNAGVDLKILNNKISIEIDVYNAETSNVLVNRTIPTASGYSSVWTNIGGINNKGLEFGIITENISTETFHWQTRGQFTINRDKITKLYGGEQDRDLGNSWFVGKPISSIYTYNVDGIWQEEDLFNKTILANYYPGQFKLRDLNEDGKITATDDRAIIGYGTPNYRFSINNTLTFKNLTLNVFVNSIQGGNNYYMGNILDMVNPGGTDMAYRINRTSVRSYWRPDNPVNNASGMYYSPTIGHGLYESRSFIRLQDVTLSYSFKAELLKKYGINNLQVYTSGKNLYTWTKWPGWDPEIGGNIPMMRSLIAGVKMSF